MNFIRLLIIVSVITNLSCHSREDNRLEKKIGSLKSKIGAYFPYQEFLDSSGRLTKIDFSKSDYTIIDFWFKSCLPCIEEMKKFEKVMAGKQVSIISVSINNFQEWKKSLNDSTPNYRFL